MNKKTLAAKKTELHEVDITNSLFSGQSFRWNYFEGNTNTYYGVIGEDLFIIENIDNKHYITSTNRNMRLEENFNTFFSNYFSFDIKSSELFTDEFRERFPDIWQLIQPYLSIKILRQDAFETLITFMCAQGLGMKIIRRQISYLAREYGNKHTVTVKNKPFTYFSFPSPETLAAADPGHLRLCTNNNCIRATNIIKAASSVATGQLDLEDLKDPEMPLEAARERLSSHSGIGYKIADCVLLFGLHRFSAFPIDTHVKQYLATWFSIGESLQSLTQKNYLFLQEQVSHLLNPELAGFAGHILFHCWRKEVKHLDSY